MNENEVEIQENAAPAAERDTSWDESPEASGVSGEPAQQEAPAAAPKAEEIPVWKAKQPEVIPYARFSEQTQQLREAERQAQEYAAKVREYEAQQAQAAKLIDPEDLDIESFKDANGEPDVRAYMRERDKALIIKAQAEARAEVAAQLEQERQARAQQDAQRAQMELLKGYETRLQEAEKLDPEIREKEQYVAQVLFAPENRQFVHPDIVAEIAADPHSAAIVDRLATDPQALRSLMGPQGIKSLHRMSYEAEQGAKAAKEAQVAPARQAAPVIPAYTPAQPAAPRVMASVPGGGPATLREPESRSQSEYNRYRAKQDRNGETSSW